MATGTLTSDHVNYLIWRYLQESGHAHSAAKLQQYWLREKAPQDLPFAKNVNQHALVSLVQKGLKYHQIEHNFAKSVTGEKISAATLYFGPETGRVSTPDDDHTPRNSSSTSQQASASRKNPRDAIVNGLSIDLQPSEPAPKRPRRSNGGDVADHDAIQVDQNGFDYGQRDPQEPASPGGYSATDGQGLSVMDIDDDDAAHDLKLALPRTNGESRAVQSDKVDDLTSSAVLLTVPERDNIMHTIWHPHKAMVLATGGDALCRFWQITQEAGLGDQLSEQYHDILMPGDKSLVTSMAWSPDGRMLAIATRADASEMTGSVATWTDTGTALDDLIAGQEMVIKLQWNANGSLLLGITSSGEGTSSLIVWDMTTSESLPPVHCDKIITDATFTGPSSIIVCGHGAVGRWDISSQQEIAWAYKVNQQIIEGRWTQIVSNPYTEMLALFDEDNGQVMVLDANGVAKDSYQAHREAITAVTYKSYLRFHTSPAPLLATCSLDGTVKYWDTATLRPVYSLTFGQENPPLALAFSPDGVRLAAASHNKLLVWETKGGNLPIASWKGELGKPPRSALTNGHSSADRDSGIGDDGTEDGMNEPSVSLDWDADGKRLALGVGNQIALITVNP